MNGSGNTGGKLSDLGDEFESLSHVQDKYRVADWPSYDRALVGSGDVTLWMSPEGIATWAPRGRRHSGRATKVLRRRHLNGIDAPSSVPPAAWSEGGVPAFALRDDGHGPLRPGRSSSAAVLLRRSERDVIPKNNGGGPIHSIPNYPDRRAASRDESRFQRSIYDVQKKKGYQSLNAKTDGVSIELIRPPDVGSEGCVFAV